ncbi:YhgE/Pip domain-containing protein [Gemella sp. GH3]|uniref:YhgE/Pip domain-containing protein n=1 Tax=unclassified Gemella TaxID=2624949 RepID=UPI0015D06701|nr:MULTISPECIES: YhgE/Pip domain-containing protein [unclassified Gemella]MBF0713357.1 YhgE/Pip domain-containing protein [Gemella sp. GH3.1]NYS50309.1 YhgE/Pip domain-containing protein [Gemella sp. GH3]
MIKKEVKAVFRNKKLVISLIAILFLPLIYAGIFAKSMWDPYGRTDKVPVAVVNEDLGATSGGESINIGNTLVDKLKDSNDFNWHFVSREDADKGVEGNGYYMALYINKDFTEKALNKGTETIPLEYKVNPAKNYAGYMMTKSGANAISSNLNKQITEKYVTAISENLNTLKNKLGDASSGTEQIIDGSNKLGDGLSSLGNGLITLNNGQTTMMTKIDEASGQYAKINNGLSSVSNKLPELSSGQLTLAEGLGTLSAGGTKLVENGSLFQNGINDLSKGIVTLDNSLQASLDKASLQENQNKLLQLQAGSSSVQDALAKLSEGASRLNNGIQTMDNSVPSSEQLLAIKNSIQNAGVNTQVDLSKLAITSEQMTNINNTYALALGNNPAFSSLSQSEQDSILATVNATNAQVMTTVLQNLKVDIDQALADVKIRTEQQKTDILKLVTGLENIRNGLDNGLVSGMMSLDTGLSNLNNGYGQVNLGTNQLITATQSNQKSIMTMAEGVTKLKDGSLQLSDKYTEYNAGVSKLNTGLQSALNGSEQLVNGVNTLESGVNELASGSDMFNNQFFPQVNNGLYSLITGTNKLVSGSEELSSGNHKITDSLNILNEGLANGVSALEENNLAEKVQFITTPTSTEKTAINDVSNYGMMFAAYLIPLGFYIAAIAFNTIYSMTSSSDYSLNRKRKWHRGKIGMMLIQAIAQAIITGFLMQSLVGLSVENKMHYYIILVIISLAYMAFITLLTITMGNIGRFVSIILLVLQLASAGGTFPIETSNSFFMKLHDILPMTKALQGLQHAIAGGLNGNYRSALVYLTIMFVIMLILIRLYYLYNETNREKYKKLLNT